MRGVFLVGLLISIAILAYVWSTHTGAVIKKGNEAKQEAERIAGHDAWDSITTEAQVINSKPCLVVTKIDPAGPMAKQYGLVLNDQIVQVGDYPSADEPGYLLEAYRRNQPIVVLRGGQRVTLPQPGKIPPH